MNQLPSPPRNSSGGWSWTQHFAMQTILVLFDFAGMVVVRRVDWDLVDLIGLSPLLLVPGQAVSVLVLVGFGGKSWYGAYSWGVGIYVGIQFVMGWVSQFDRSTVLAIVLLSPLQVAIGALPAWALRFLFGWRIEDSRQPPPAPRRFALTDLFSVTAVCAVVAAATRLSHQLAGADSNDFWSMVGVMGAVLLGIGAILVPTCSCIALGGRRGCRRDRVFPSLFLSGLVTICLCCGTAILPSELAAAVALLGFATYFVLVLGVVLLLPLRLMGKRLSTERGRDDSRRGTELPSNAPTFSVRIDRSEGGSGFQPE